MGTPRPTGTFCWSELGTSDATGAIRFYSALFGWRADPHDMGEMGTYTVLQLGDDDLGGLYELSGPMFAGIPPHWMYYVAVEDVDATSTRVPELGGKLVMPPTDVPNVGRMAVIEDPTGAKLSLMQRGGHQGCTLDPMQNGGFGWVELNTRDVPAATAFYTALFGWQSRGDSSDMPYTEWSLPGGPPFGGMMQMNANWGEAPPHWLGYVMVDDCDATFAKATSLGARPYCPPMTVEGVGRLAVIADPQGAVFAFIHLFPQVH
ncbi:MAG: VOC family protein [Planctomycetes bacterium]|nr:VOC family protein [Planctomycetota bacterium]